MAKPILIVRVPNSFAQERMVSDIANTIIENSNNEYWVFCVVEKEREVFGFECFNHNLPDIELEQLYEKLKVGLKDGQE